MSNPIPLSLYIHIPWCIKKCPYCDFNSHQALTQVPEQEYIDCLLQDLEQDLAYVQGRRIHSIFFGGGTPSLFSISGIEKILHGISSKLNFQDKIEITLEANPGTLERKNFKDYAAIGVNRISLGAQSFQDEKLKSLGRIHSSSEIVRALESLQAHFQSFNIDLMYGLPNQSVQDALYDLNKALSFSPPHLSWYNLTLEPNTIFHAKPPLLPAEDYIAEMQSQGIDLLSNSQLKHYEVSAFAKSGFSSQHNLNYWQFGDYLGIGAGAHGKITLLNSTTEVLGLPENRKDPENQYSQNCDHPVIIRYAKKRLPKSYLGMHKTPEQRILTNAELPFEFMLNALRLSEGFPVTLFQERTGLELTSISDTLLTAEQKGLLYYQNLSLHPDQNPSQHIIPTALGKRFLNDLIELFLPKTY